MRYEAWARVGVAHEVKCCDLCGKYRRLLAPAGGGGDGGGEEGGWVCAEGDDDEHNSCEAEEEDPFAILGMDAEPAAAGAAGAGGAGPAGGAPAGGKVKGGKVKPTQAPQEERPRRLPPWVKPDEGWKIIKARRAARTHVPEPHTMGWQCMRRQPTAAAGGRDDAGLDPGPCVRGRREPALPLSPRVGRTPENGPENGLEKGLEGSLARRPVRCRRPCAVAGGGAGNKYIGTEEWLYQPPGWQYGRLKGFKEKRSVRAHTSFSLAPSCKKPA